MSESVNALIAQGGVQQGQNPLGMVSNVLDLARGAQTLKAQQFNLQQAQLQPAYQAMRQLMVTNPNPSWDDVNAALAQSKRIGGNVDGLVANAAEIAANGGKPADFMRATALGGMSPESQGTLAGPQMQQRQTAQGTYYGTTGGAWSPNANVFSPTGFVAQGLSPGQATEFVTVPDVDANGRPTGTVHMVPRGTLFGGGTGVGGGDGGGGVGAPASGGGGGPVPAAAAGPPPGSPVAPGTPLSQKDAALATFAQRESGNQNIFSKVQVPGYTQEQTGSGYYQIIPSTWAEGQQLAGIPPAQQTKLAIQASPQQQYQVASALYDKYGGKPWAQSAPQGQGGGGPPATGAFIGATATQPVGGGGGMQYFPASPGGGGGGIPGVQRGPGGAPILTAPPPGMVESLQTAADASTKQYAADNVAAGQYQQRVWPLVQSANILDKYAPTTGQGAEAVRSIIGHLQTLGNIFTGGDIQNIGQSKFEELGKYLQQAVNASPFAAGSNDRLAAAITGSPNTHMTNLANQDVVKAMIAQERMKQMAITDFNNQGGQPMNWTNFLRQWQTAHDPRAFLLDMMPQDKRQQLVKSMSPIERTNFDNTLTLIQSNPGVMIRPAMP